MDDGLVTALAGGAIGTVLVGIAWAILRLAAIPADVDRHDEIARFVDEDLELWVADSHRALRRELAQIEGDMSARGALFSGAHGASRAEAKTRTLHRYRDRLHECERQLSELQTRESWAHGLWRRVTRSRPLTLTAPARVRPVLDEWRADVIQHGSSPADRVPVHDPTRWRLADLLEEIRREPLERAKY